jgi:hypothetical protein
MNKNYLKKFCQGQQRLFDKTLVAVPKEQQLVELGITTKCRKKENDQKRVSRKPNKPLII